MIAAPPYAIVRAVRAELAVPGRYHLTVARAHRSLVGQAVSWVWLHARTLWEGLMRHVHVGRAGVTVVGDVIVLLCVVAVAAVAAHLLLQFQLERVQPGTSERIAPAKSAQSFAVAAAAAASAGEYPRAVRLLFIAAVTLLDIRGALHDERSATVNDLRRALGERDAALEASFVDLARIYTGAAYAEKAVDRTTWSRAQSAYAALKERSAG